MTERHLRIVHSSLQVHRQLQLASEPTTPLEEAINVINLPTAPVSEPAPELGAVLLSTDEFRKLRQPPSELAGMAMNQIVDFTGENIPECCDRPRKVMATGVTLSRQGNMHVIGLELAPDDIDYERMAILEFFKQVAGQAARLWTKSTRVEVAIKASAESVRQEQLETLQAALPGTLWLEAAEIVVGGKKPYITRPDFVRHPPLRPGTATGKILPFVRPAYRNGTNT